MTIDDIRLLQSDEIRRAIDDNVARDPAAVALDRRVPHSSLVATQVKYLQRARRKLPSLYAARCIIPPRAFEQSSSEECARRKRVAGGAVLDLTCGLGIDAMALASRFERVVALERDSVLAEVVRYNMELLGVENVEVVNTSAEEYLSRTTEHFDWLFADPDRRSSDGRKMVCMEDCSPDIMSLRADIARCSERMAVKLSPLFDCEEAFRLLSPVEVEVVSVGGECKEVNLYAGAERDVLRIAVVGLGEWEFDVEQMHAHASAESFTAGDWQYLLIPDVALQKGRVAIAALSPYAAIWSNNGFAFAHTLPEVTLPVRAFRIEAIMPYRPKELKRRYKGCGVDIIKRDCAVSVEALRRSASLRAGSDHTIAITTIGGESWVIELNSLPL